MTDEGKYVSRLSPALCVCVCTFALHRTHEWRAHTLCSMTFVCKRRSPHERLGADVDVHADEAHTLLHHAVQRRLQSAGRHVVLGMGKKSETPRDERTLTAK